MPNSESDGSTRGDSLTDFSTGNFLSELKRAFPLELIRDVDGTEPAVSNSDTNRAPPAGCEFEDPFNLPNPSHEISSAAAASGIVHQAPALAAASASAVKVGVEQDRGKRSLGSQRSKKSKPSVPKRRRGKQTPDSRKRKASEMSDEGISNSPKPPVPSASIDLSNPDAIANIPYDDFNDMMHKLSSDKANELKKLRRRAMNRRSAKGSSARRRGREAELQKKNEQLQKRVTELEQKNATLSKEKTALQQRIDTLQAQKPLQSSVNSSVLSRFSFFDASQARLPVDSESLTPSSDLSVSAVAASDGVMLSNAASFSLDYDLLASVDLPMGSAAADGRPVCSDVAPLRLSILALTDLSDNPFSADAEAVLSDGASLGWAMNPLF